MRNPISLLIACLILMAAIGCSTGNGGTPLPPAFLPHVVDSRDDFQFSVTGVSKVTQTLTYQWQNTGAAATIDQTGSVSAGSAMIKVLDANNSMVYSADLNSSGSFVSTTGTTGSWTIQVVLSKTSGAMSFHLQKM
jgi:hypothetical protein